MDGRLGASLSVQPEMPLGGGELLRIQVTAEDLLKVRFAPEPAPLMELGLAVAMTQRTDPAFARRRRSLPAGPLRQLVPPSGAGPLFLDPLSRDLDEGLELVRSSSGALVRAELSRICTAGLPATPLLRGLAEQDQEAWRFLERALRGSFAALVGPAWPRLRAGFDADRVWRRAVLADQGLGAMLTGIIPGSRWRGAVLEIPSPRDRELRPDGAGLVLLPSALWTGGPLFAPHPDGGLLVVYPALTPLPQLDPAAAGEDAVAGLLGRTRAAVLRGTTARETTTGELADGLGISPASASEHTRALRRAGLLTTVRTGRSVRHAVTPLGERLLDGGPRKA